MSDINKLIEGLSDTETLEDLDVMEIELAAVEKTEKEAEKELRESEIEKGNGYKFINFILL